MDNKIIVRFKNVYGKELIYPVCKKAMTFSRLIGKLTFSASDILTIKMLGFVVETEQTTKTL